MFNGVYAYFPADLQLTSVNDNIIKLDYYASSEKAIKSSEIRMTWTNIYNIEFPVLFHISKYTTKWTDCKL